MKHIKYLKERRANQESEFDLRGLGDTSAIRAEYPLTHLSVHTANVELIKQCTSIFSLDFKKSKHENMYHVFSPRHDLNHKEKSVVLFGAAMYISHIDANAKMFMNEINQLAKLIKNEQPEDSEDRDEQFLEWMKTNHHLSVHPGMQLYLQQAGFDIHAESTFQNFKRETLKNLRTTTQKSGTQTRNRKKALGE